MRPSDIRKKRGADAIAKGIGHGAVVKNNTLGLPDDWEVQVPCADGSTLVLTAIGWYVLDSTGLRMVAGDEED